MNSYIRLFCLLALALSLCMGGCASSAFENPALAVGVGTHGGGISLLSDNLAVGAGRFYGRHGGFSGGGVQVGLGSGYRGSGYTQRGNMRVIPAPEDPQEAAPEAAFDPGARQQAAHPAPTENARPPLTSESRADWNRYDGQHHSLLPYYRGQSLRR